MSRQLKPQPKPKPPAPPRSRRIALLAVVLAVAAAGVYFATRTTVDAEFTAPRYTYRVLHTYPHDTTAFTQGLEYRNGFLYEGTGLKGSSTLRKVELETGKVLQRINLSPEYFGEGITVLNNQIVELTWQAQRGFVYDFSTFNLLRSFNYPGEGWGLTNDGKRIYMSDGSAWVRIWNGSTLAEEDRIHVRDGAQEITNLNELEWVKDEVYANVWQTNWVIRISPKDGHVLGWIDLSGLLTPEELASGVDVLNGIAYDAAGGRLFVTGKLWPKLLEIELVPEQQ